MQILMMLIFLGVWLFILWFGSIALEASGMERSKARFQALSAITGTGFTTGEAEAVVNHPRRRRIITWLIVLGNTGIVAFLIVLILFVRGGLTAPSPLLIGVVSGVLLVLALSVWLGWMNKLTSAILALVRKKQPGFYEVSEMLHQAGGYGLVCFVLGKEARGTVLEDTGLLKQGITLLAIERGDTALPFPGAGERLLAGDRLLCYGRLEELAGLG